MSSDKQHYQRRTYAAADDDDDDADADADADADDSGHDPYNKPSASRYALLEQQYLAETARAEQQQQYAYDSMSTILEVDSEGSEVSADRFRDKDSASVSALLSSGKKTSNNKVIPTGHEDRSMSPIAEGRGFSGALSALAQQVERLSQETSGQVPSRAAEEKVAPADSRPSSNSSDGKRSSHKLEEDQEISIDSSNNETFTLTNSPATMSFTNDDDDNDDESAGEERPRSRPISAAESLMMIALSPIVSPRIRQSFPLHQEDDESSQTGIRRLVEVSNKSTITSIDSGLMDKMVQKYFVDKLDKGVQSIAFDCEESGETVESYKNRTGRRERNSGASSTSGAVSKTKLGPMMKSVAVGTEKFSRERFSLLPPTKTRSTQTKSNIDNDIGASETRRFKLSHLDFGSLRRSHRQNTDKPEATHENEAKDNPTEGERNSVIDETSAAQSERSQLRLANNPTEGSRRIGSPSIAGSADDFTSSNRLTSPEHVPTEAKAEQSINDSSLDSVEASKEKSTSPASAMQQDSLTDSPASSNKSNLRPKSPTPSKSPAKLELTINELDGKVAEGSSRGVSNVNESLSIINRDVARRPLELSKESGKGSSISIRQDGASLIPNLKTELRVIIEFNDSRHRQRSELTSNSQLVDGKLSKQSQINTSKYIRNDAAERAATSALSSPRDVYRRLDSAGREHSLMLNARRGQPEGIRASLTPLRAASSMSSLIKPNSNDGQNEGWRQVSKSSVCNEIETDTHRPRHQKEVTNEPVGRDKQKHQLLVSTEADIRYLPDDKSALELRSRAAKRYERLERDPTTKQVVGPGKMFERTLVLSEAGFDESELENAVANAKATPVQMVDRKKQPLNRSQDSINAPEQTKPMLRVSDAESFDQIGMLGKQDHKVPNMEQKSFPEFQQPPKKSESPNVDQSKITTARRTNARLEIEEESENRRQVTRNGRLVFDDRLNERRYETHKSVTNDESPKPNRKSEQRPMSSPARASTSPLLSPGGILRNAHVQSPVQRHLLKPISLRASPSQQFVDQTSNLSSDPETMDSGIAPSGAGSSNALNQRPVQTSSSRASRQKDSQPIYQSRRQTEEPISLTFVDDDEDDDEETDDFVEQLGSEKGDQAKVTHPKSYRSDERIEKDNIGEIPPPPEFRSMSGVGNKPVNKSPEETQKNASINPTKSLKLEKGPRRNDTELITRLTRTRPNPQHPRGQKPITKTKFEQNLVAPKESSAQAYKQELDSKMVNRVKAGCGLKAQVMFESDTDSSMVLERSGQSNKELFSETKYSSSGRRTHSPLTELDEPDKSDGESKPKSSHNLRAEKKISTPNCMDYSLRVHRMRGSQIDSKVNTFIKHTRQSLINLEAS